MTHAIASITDESLMADVERSLELAEYMGTDPAETVKCWDYQSSGYKLGKNPLGGYSVAWRGMIFDNRYATLTAAKKAVKSLIDSNRRRAVLARTLLSKAHNLGDGHDCI